MTILLQSHIFANQMSSLVVDLDKINLDDNNNFDEDNPDTITYVRLLAWRSNFKRAISGKKI